jgi:hypothetical protein
MLVPGNGRKAAPVAMNSAARRNASEDEAEGQVHDASPAVGLPPSARSAEASTRCLRSFASSAESPKPRHLA